MIYATPEDRDRFIAGLRELAAFLESNPEVPAPPDATVYVFPPANKSDQVRRAEVDRIASHISSQAATTRGGHYVSSRFFGPVEYRVIAIPRETADNTEEA